MGYFSSLLSLSKFATETALNVAELVIIASGLLLAFGAIGEYLEEHDRLPRWMAWPKLVFIILVVASLIGEFLGDAGVFVFSEHLQSINDQEEEALRMRVKSEIDARIAHEQEVLEQGPRDLMLSAKRSETLVNSLGQFKGQKVQIRKCQFNDKEAGDTATRLTALFELARWDVSMHSPQWGESNCLIDDPTASGIWIGIPNHRPEPRTQEITQQLLQFFRNVPLTAILHAVHSEVARGESGRNIVAQYGDADSIVVVVLAHP